MSSRLKSCFGQDWLNVDCTAWFSFQCTSQSFSSKGTILMYAEGYWLPIMPKYAHNLNLKLWWQHLNTQMTTSQQSWRPHKTKTQAATRKWEVTCQTYHEPIMTLNGPLTSQTLAYYTYWVVIYCYTDSRSYNHRFYARISRLSVQMIGYCTVSRHIWQISKHQVLPVTSHGARSSCSNCSCQLDPCSSQASRHVR